MENQVISPQNTRNKNIDLMKGICIIFMIIGHTALVEKFVFGVIYLFYMAVFFIASGFLFKSKYTDSIKMFGVFIVKKLKGLWLPFFLFTELFIVLNNLFIYLNIYLTAVPASLDSTLKYSMSEYMNVKSVLMSIPNTVIMDNATHMGGALWFFKTLFYVLVFYAICDYIIKKISQNKRVQLFIQGVVSVVLSAIGFYCSLHNVLTYSWGRIASVYILIYIGVLFRKLDIIKRLFEVSHKWIVNTLLIIVNSFVLVLCYVKIDTIAIDQNSYVNPVYFVISSLLGFFFVSSVSNILIYLNLRINTLLAYISKRAVSIIALHFLCFKLVSYLGIVIYGIDQRYLAAFPVLFKNGVWWLLYTVVGISIPLFLDYFYLMAKESIMKRVRPSQIN